MEAGANKLVHLDFCSTCNQDAVLFRDSLRSHSFPSTIQKSYCSAILLNVSNVTADMLVSIASETWPSTACEIY